MRQGLGFVNRALYLMPHFFKDKPVERLLGDGIEAEHLNDDALGRALDTIYAYGPEALYSQLARNAGLYSRAPRGWQHRVWMTLGELSDCGWRLLSPRGGYCPLVAKRKLEPTSLWISKNLLLRVR